MNDNQIIDCAELEELINYIGFNFLDSNEDYSFFKTHINKLIEKLYNLSKEQNYYWQLCSFNTWQKTIDKRSSEFIDKYRDTGANYYSFYFEESNRLTKQVDTITKEFIYLCEKNGVEKRLYFKTEKIDIYKEIELSFNRINLEVQSKIELLNKQKSVTTIKSTEKHDILTSNLEIDPTEKFPIEDFKKNVSKHSKSNLESTYISNEIETSKIKLSKELINSIEKENSIMYFDFDFDKIEIESKFKHEILLNSHFKINEYIEKYYFKTTEIFLSESEYKEWQKKGFIGRKLTALMPYSVNINGAYYHRPDLVFKLITIVNEKPKKIKIGKNNIVYFHDLEPYFKEYNKGFEKGFNNFENKYINDYLPMYADKTDFVHQTFQFITLKDENWNSWHNNVKGFNKSINSEILINDAYSNGLKNGYYYKAWSLIFTNSHLFNNLFENLYKEHNSIAPEPNKESKLNATSIAFFCAIIDRLGIYKISEYSSVKSFCDVVTEKYKIVSNNNQVRKYFNEYLNYKNDFYSEKIKVIKEKILPTLESFKDFNQISKEVIRISGQEKMK